MDFVYFNSEMKEFWNDLNKRCGVGAAYTI